MKTSALWGLSRIREGLNRDNEIDSSSAIVGEWSSACALSNVFFSVFRHPAAAGQEQTVAASREPPFERPVHSATCRMATRTSRPIVDCEKPYRVGLQPASNPPFRHRLPRTSAFHFGELAFGAKSSRTSLPKRCHSNVRFTLEPALLSTE